MAVVALVPPKPPQLLAFPWLANGKSPPPISS